MALVKREQVMEQVLTTVRVTHANAVRRIGDFDEKEMDFTGFPTSIVRDDESTDVVQRPGGFEKITITVIISGLFESVTPTQANDYISEIKENLYGDNVLRGLTEIYKISSDSKRRVLNHRYIAVDVVMAIEYEEKVLTL